MSNVLRKNCWTQTEELTGDRGDCVTWSFMIFTPCTSKQGDKMWKVDVDGLCGMYE